MEREILKITLAILNLSNSHTSGNITRVNYDVRVYTRVTLKMCVVCNLNLSKLKDF